MTRLLLAALLFLHAGAVLAEKLTLTYDVARAGQPIGETRETFERANHRYRIESIAKPKGVAAIFIADTFRMVSEGEFSDTGLRPLHFEYHRSTKPNKAILSDFDWTTNTLTARFEGKTETQPLPGHAQDRLSALYQLRYWPKAESESLMAVSNGKNIREHRYKRTGEETLTVPAGTFHTVRYARERTPDDDGIAIWMSEQLPAPIKIVIDEKKGAQNEQVLTAYQREP